MHKIYEEEARGAPWLALLSTISRVECKAKGNRVHYPTTATARDNGSIVGVQLWENIAQGTSAIVAVSTTAFSAAVSDHDRI